ncbi:MAG: IS1249 family transposase, partial [Micrococcaceae bacterium]|nr:IS1249 family transposase [Micrococcaceae bacterium]
MQYRPHALKACVVKVPANQPRCGVCTQKLVKNGKTSSGRTRWRCKQCGASSTQSREDLSRRAEFTVFLAWINGKQRQEAHATSERTFRRRAQWCWNVIPEAPVTGEIHQQIMLDGTYFNGWCVLIAYTGSHVVAWQWCDREKHASWSALLQRIPAPAVAIVDGHKGLESALKQHWKETRVQRCMFHIQQNIRTHLTMRPKLDAGKELLALTKTLTPIEDLDQAAAWMGEFASWTARWEGFLRHRTYAKKNTARPSHVPAGQTWWYTHLRLRRARATLATVVASGHLFTWLSTSVESQRVDRTTSPLEGGINAGIKHLLRDHRGLSDTHAQRAVDWYLYQRTEARQDPWQLVRPEHWKPERKHVVVVEEPVGPAVYDTAFSAEDGNGIQKGWGGR